MLGCRAPFEVFGLSPHRASATGIYAPEGDAGEVGEAAGGGREGQT